MKKKFVICTVLSCLIFVVAFLSLATTCSNVDFDNYSTDDINDYKELKENYEYYLRIFPDNPSTNAINSFSFNKYEFHSHNIDVILKSAYDDAQSFADDLNNSLAFVKSSYRINEIKDQFINGYSNIYVGGFKNFSASDTYDTVLNFTDDGEYYYQWTLISYSLTDKVIIYNHAAVDYRDCIKYGFSPNFTKFTGFAFTPDDEFAIKF